MSKERMVDLFFMAVCAAMFAWLILEWITGPC